MATYMTSTFGSVTKSEFSLIPDRENRCNCRNTLHFWRPRLWRTFLPSLSKKMIQLQQSRGLSHRHHGPQDS